MKKPGKGIFLALLAASFGFFSKLVAGQTAAGSSRGFGQFLVILFILALAWGYIIQKTESLWGAVLFHAGADLLVIVSILQSFNH